MSFRNRSCSWWRAVAKFRTNFHSSWGVPAASSTQWHCRTLGLHNYLYVLRQGVDHVLVHPMPQELKFRLKKDALGKIQLDAMLLESLKASSKIFKFSTIEQPEIRMSSRWQMVNFTSWRSRCTEIYLEQWKPRVAIIYSETNLCACWWLGMPGNLHLAQLADRYVIDKFFWTPDHQIMSRTTILHWAWILINIATLIHRRNSDFVELLLICQLLGLCRFKCFCECEIFLYQQLILNVITVKYNRKENTAILQTKLRY